MNSRGMILETPPLPSVVLLNQVENFFRLVGLFPIAGQVLVGFSPCRVGVDCTQNGVESKIVFHGGYKLHYEFSGVGADDGGAQNFVTTGARSVP